MVEAYSPPMDLDTFCRRIAHAKALSPRLFELDRVLPPTRLMLANIEEELGVRFPEEYSTATTIIGGGQIGFATCSYQPTQKAGAFSTGIRFAKRPTLLRFQTMVVEIILDSKPQKTGPAIRKSAG